MFKQVLLLGMGCSFLACGGSSDGSSGGIGGSSNTAGVAQSAGAANGGTSAGAAGGLGGSGGNGVANAGSGTGGASVAGSSGASASSGTGGTSVAGSSGANTGGGAASMADVQAIFNARCVTCHDATKGGLPTYPQLALTVGNANASLVNKQGLETCGGTLVVPGNPDQSYLVHKLNDATPCEGMRMPRQFEVLPSPPLSDAQMTTIRSWISAGAKP